MDTMLDNYNITEKEVRTSMKKRGFKNVKVRKIGFDDVKDREKGIKNLCKYLKKRYGKNIILMEVHEAGLRLDRRGKVTMSLKDDAKEREEIMERYFPVFKKELGCHVIRNPPTIIRDAFHVWGESEVHYVQEFYDYAIACIDAITDCHDKKEEKRRLDALYSDLESKLDGIKDGTYLSRNNTLRRVDRRWRTSERVKGIDRLIRTCKAMMKKTEDPVTIRELQRRIGVFWLKREDGKVDTRKSISYLKKSVEAGSPAAKEDLLEALWADESTPDEDVLQMARERRIEGSPMALAVLGMAHKDGRGVDRNPERAKQLLWHASRKGVDWAKKEFRSIEE